VHEYCAGVVIDSRGLILTTHHALGDIERNEYTVFVPGRGASRTRAHPATLKAADPWSDLAVLEIAAPANELAVMPLGDALKLKKGSFVISLGNPQAIARDGEASSSWGIISSLGRRVKLTESRRTSQQGIVHEHGTLLETDARLNMGSSGGALIDLSGEMIGLITALPAAPGFERAAGYAVPLTDEIKKVIEQLKAGKVPRYGFLGVGAEDSTPRDGARIRGARVSGFVPGSPASMARLQTGDIITHVDGRPVGGADGLIALIGSRQVGDTARLTVLRRRLGAGGAGRSKEQVAVRLARRAPVADRPQIETAKPRLWRGMGVDHAIVAPQLGLSRSPGINPYYSIQATHVERDSPAWKAGLRERMLISHVNGRRIHMPAEFFAAVAPRSGPVRLRISGSIRGGNEIVVPPPPGD